MFASKEIGKPYRIDHVAVLKYEAIPDCTLNVPLEALLTAFISKNITTASKTYKPKDVWRSKGGDLNLLFMNLLNQHSPMKPAHLPLRLIQKLVINNKKDIGAVFAATFSCGNSTCGVYNSTLIGGIPVYKCTPFNKRYRMKISVNCRDIVAGRRQLLKGTVGVTVPITVTMRFPCTHLGELGALIVRDPLDI